MLLDLGPLRPLLAPEAPSWDHFNWSEFAPLWDGNDLAAAHDWLNERWTRLIRNRPGGHQDPEAQFLQSLAYATLALHFTQHGNQDGALLMLDDALVALGRYRPEFLGVQVDPVLATLNELRPLLVGLAPNAECPLWPFVYRKFEFRG
jgi:uncharacterized protein